MFIFLVFDRPLGCSRLNAQPGANAILVRIMQIKGGSPSENENPGACFNVAWWQP